ncbi:MAG TPA: Vms1/Ankzf1 family peptidyl-tRNA hydrolase [Dehalococcoidia bacterium]|nr:Vms1/Ankzf1 family peptidyl-tRNA hydrolase [Dehalococcoidia bacterium]
MNELLRRLADIPPGDLPFLSIYLDVRPEVPGERPGRRAGLVVFEDRMREIRRTYLPRGPKLDSFDADADRINRWLREEMQRSTEGAAIFACSGRGVFETVEAGVPFENQVTAAEAPDLYQLARFDDEFETALAAVLDTNTLRLFVYRYGTLSERGGIDDDPVHYQKRQVGGWSQARYQRHIDNHRREFTAEIGKTIAGTAEREGATRIVLAGDPPSIAPLVEQMPRDALEKVRDVVKLDLRATRNEVLAEVEPVLREAEARSGESAVERLVAEVRKGQLAATGAPDVERALDNGQVDELLIDDTADVGDSVRATLTRKALATGATIEAVAGSSPLLALGGVGAVLRYRLSDGQ